MKITLNDKEMGTRIMELRKDKGYSREKLAELVGISSKFLYEIEIRKTGFSVNTLRGISQALDISSDYILFGKDNNVIDNTKNLLSDFTSDQIQTGCNMLKELADLIKKI